MSGTPNLVDALREARRLGCEVTYPRRTGEVLVVAPDGSRVRANNRRKDSTKALLQLLKRVGA